MLLKHFAFLSAAACIAACAVSARAEWTLTTADFSEQRQLTVNTWDAQGLSVTGPDGKLVRIPTRDVVSLASDRSITRSKPWRLCRRQRRSPRGRADRHLRPVAGIQMRDRHDRDSSEIRTVAEHRCNDVRGARPGVPPTRM